MSRLRSGLGRLPPITITEETVQPESAPQPFDSVHRAATVKRETRETKVTLELDLDGSGRATVATGLGFFDHMLELLAAQGLFDLTIEAQGDLHTGGHHTVEDVGICLGSALSEAVGDKRGITRYGSMLLPMDEALVMVALDLSGRPYFAYDGGPVGENIAGFSAGLVAEFFRSVANNARLTLHVRVLSGGDAHHTIEAVFKGVGRALRQAVSLDPRAQGIPSTKGVL
ncbi:MAG: imidazoleglycerol-phosphate dehydratase HisB [Actinobacteria bacterium]|nr:imidazoleglycerol-phosphate dehydratase HisB [Actinomycetota bacterium]